MSPSAVTPRGRRRGRDADAMAQSWQDMAARLQTPEGKTDYTKRAATIEPVFAQLTALLGRDLHYRDDIVDAEISQLAASHWRTGFWLSRDNAPHDLSVPGPGAGLVCGARA